MEKEKRRWKSRQIRWDTARRKTSHCRGFSTIVWLLTGRKAEARRTAIPKENTGKKHTMRVRRAFVAGR